MFVGAVEIALRLGGAQVCGDAGRVELNGLWTFEDEQPIEIGNVAVELHRDGFVLRLLPGGDRGLRVGNRGELGGR